MPNYPPSKYRALGQEFERGDARRVMSRSELWRFGRLPSKWKAGGFDKEANAGMDHGALVDCLLLTPELYEELYQALPETYPAAGKKKDDPVEQKPWNRNANYCKEWEADIEASGKTAIKLVDLNVANAAIRRLKEDASIMAVMDGAQFQVFAQVEWKDDATGLVIPIKCLFDIVPKVGPITDLKTTKDASLRAYSRSVFDLGYHVQAALYSDAHTAVTSEFRPSFRHIISENEPPYETAKRWLSEEYLDLGRQTYKTLMHQYCQCLANNHWPGYDEWGEEMAVNGWGCISPSPWMILEQ